VLVLVLVIVAFSIWLPSTFPTRDTVDALLSSLPVNIGVALAALIPLVAGEFDLAVGYTLGISSVMVAWCTGQGLPLGVAILLALALGLGIGVVNGFLVVGVGINSFIATLGTGTVISGVILQLTGGNVLSKVPTSLLSATFHTVGGVPYALFYVLVLAVIVAYVLDHTPLGRFLRQVGSAYPTIGPEFLLPAFAAAFLGATMFRPDTFNVPGLLVASLLLVVGVAGLSQGGAPSWVTPIFDGGVLVVAVGVSVRGLRRQG
jgi:ribose transport system permease protein